MDANGSLCKDEVSGVHIASKTKQVKSATENVGTFDKVSGNIRRASCLKIKYDALRIIIFSSFFTLLFPH